VNFIKCGHLWTGGKGPYGRSRLVLFLLFQICGCSLLWCWSINIVNCYSSHMIFAI